MTQVHTIVILALILCQVPAAIKKNTEPTLDPTTVPLPENNSTRLPYVPGNGFVAIPERGMLLERTGTLITHSNYEVASVIIKTKTINFAEMMESARFDLSCNMEAARSAQKDYDAQMSHLHISH